MSDYELADEPFVEPTRRELVWTQVGGRWTQVPKEVIVGTKNQTSKPVALYVPGVEMAIELLRRMHPQDRASVLKAFGIKVDE